MLHSTNASILSLDLLTFCNKEEILVLLELKPFVSIYLGYFVYSWEDELSDPIGCSMVIDVIKGVHTISKIMDLANDS